MLACSHAPQASPAVSAKGAAGGAGATAAGGTGEILVDSDFVHAETKEVIAAWLVYGANKMTLWNSRTPKLPDQAADAFEVEMAVRELLAEAWGQQRAKGTPSNAELDLLVAMNTEGLMAPYLLTHWALPGWTIPPKVLATIDFARFRRWAEVHLVGYVPVRHVLFEPRDGLTFPKVPGADLPDPSEYNPERIPCPQSHERVQRAVAHWAEERARLPGSPLAARDRVALVREVERVRTVAPYSERGITWVDERVHTLHYVAGFCAVEAGQWHQAEDMLRTAIALIPSDTHSRSELAQVYIRTHRLDEADATLREVLALGPSNKCEGARIMRAQGFVLVERGQLLEAFQIYGRSLELDPGSTVAQREMAFISGELRRRGSADVPKLDARLGPTKVNTTVTHCPP